MKYSIKFLVKFCTISLLFLIIALGIVYQPLFMRGVTDKQFSKIGLSDANLLKEYVKRLSEMDRTSQDGRGETVRYIREIFENIGVMGCDQSNHDGWCYSFQEYAIEGDRHQNIVVKRKAYEGKKYIVGAHFDSFHGLPGADDNASGVAGILELIRIFHQNEINPKKIGIEFILYSSEEPPYFASRHMGSYVHAQSIKDQDIVGAIILEMIGYYSEASDSQTFPISILQHIYPSEGNFIALISDTKFQNISLTRKVKFGFHTYLNSKNSLLVYSVNAPRFLQGVDFSDHRNYWIFDIPAIMITDTSFYRNKNYHTLEDTYTKLNYQRMKEVVDAVIYFLHSE